MENSPTTSFIIKKTFLLEWLLVLVGSSRTLILLSEEKYNSEKFTHFPMKKNPNPNK